MPHHHPRRPDSTPQQYQQTQDYQKAMPLAPQTYSNNSNNNSNNNNNNNGDNNNNAANIVATPSAT